MNNSNNTKKFACLILKETNSEVVIRCLESVLPLIDGYAIIDTGSSQEVLESIEAFFNRNALKESYLVRKDWENFAVNRNQSLELAIKHGAEYALIVDADEVAEFSEDFQLPESNTFQFWLVSVIGGNFLNHRILYVKLDRQWHYKYPVHEVLESALPSYSGGIMEGLRFRGHFDSKRALTPSIKKFEADAVLLEAECKKNPDDPRLVFYLAESYQKCNRKDWAIQTYQKRIQMGGWDQECWYASYQIAQLENNDGLMTALYNARPHRGEPLLWFANKYANTPIAKLYQYQIQRLPYTEDILFVDRAAYQSDPNNVICASYFGMNDVQRKKQTEPDDSDLIKGWVKSIEHLNLNGIIFYNNLSNDFIDKWSSSHIKFVFVDTTKYEYGPYETRWFVYRDWLNDFSPPKVFFTDLFDLQISNDPFKLCNLYSPDTLFVGSENMLIDNEWIAQKWKSAYNNELPNIIKAYPLLNCGILGGYYETVKSFINRMCSEIEQCSKTECLDMVSFNKILRYDWDYSKIMYGSHVHSEFKKFEKNRTSCCFTHK